MVYLVSSKKNIKGFSLVELIVVIGILILLIVVGDSVYTNFRSRNSLDISVSGYVQALRHAQTNSEQVQGDSVWGTAIFSDRAVVFKGVNYLSRTTSSDQIVGFPSGIVVGGLAEVVFEKTTGSALSTGTTTITNNNGEVRNIFINEKGTIIY